MSRLISVRRRLDVTKRVRPMPVAELTMLFPTRVESTWQIAVEYWRKCLVRWLTRGLFYQREDAVEKVEYGAIDESDILRAIQLSQREIRMLMDGDARTLVIGRDVAVKLNVQLSHRFYGPVPINVMAGDVMAGDGSGRTQVLGLNVLFVPWVEGWCLLPDIRR